MAPKTWNSLTDEDQQVIAECMEEANLAERELSRKMDAEAVSTLEEQGMKVTYPDKTEPVSYTHLLVHDIIQRVDQHADDSRYREFGQ